MSRNFHTLHVHLGASADPAVARDSVIDALREHLNAEGFEPVLRAAAADRVVRVSRPRAGWITISDDGHGIDAIAAHVARKTKLPALEAYCEASAIVWLALHHRGRGVGGWGVDRVPPAKAVSTLLAVGSAAELVSAWDDAVRQVFPETALAVAARRFGLDVARVFDDRAIRGTTLALRRTKVKWIPTLAAGPCRFEVGIGSNQGLGGSHLVFVNRAIEITPIARSIAGAGRGLTITFGGDVIDRGLVVPGSVTVESLGLVRQSWTGEVRDQRVFLPDVPVLAGYTTSPDLLALTRREADRVRAQVWGAELRITIAARATVEGTGTLRVGVGAGSGDPVDQGTLELTVMFEPHRPRETTAADEHALFVMHRKTRRFVTIMFDAAISEAWPWARSAIERWCLATRAAGRFGLYAERAVVESGDLVDGELTPSTAWSNIADRFASPPEATLQIVGPGFVFGHLNIARFGRALPQERAVVLTLDEPASGDHAELARALADEAMRDGLGLGALLARWGAAPGNGLTAWEAVTLQAVDALSYRAWYAERIRGLDHDGVWLGPGHLARIDRAKIPASVEVREVGPALCLSRRGDPPRAELASLEDALDAVLPSRAAADAWSRPR